jgi:tetratricopeptide (TPR) repeat protein
MGRPPPAPPNASLEAAAQRLRSGRPAEARALLEEALRRGPASPEALHLLALAYRAEGRPLEALEAHRKAFAADPKSPGLATALGDALVGVDRIAAEATYRRALLLDAGCVPAARQLGELLTASGRPEAALSVLEPLLRGPARDDQSLLHGYADALRAAGRMAEALSVRRRAAAAPTAGGVAEHNLAALLGDLGRSREAVEAARRARRRGLDAPETDLVEARALAALGEFPEAEAAFLRVLRRRPQDLAAHRDLAQTLWMATGRIEEALEPLEAALAADPRAVGLLQVKATVLTTAGAPLAALEVLTAAVRLKPDAPALRLQLARAFAACGRPEARAAEALAPGEEGAETGLIEALLAVGAAKDALERSAALLQRRPRSQAAAAYLATAARLLGDPRYQAFYDYDALVRPMELATPRGWSSLTAYLRDLAEALVRHHRNRAHPFDQSVRGGSQLADVLTLEDPPIKAFRDAMAPPVDAYVAGLGAGLDPLRQANQGGWRVAGAWSVRLEGGGGRHVNHIHADGWISSAAYIALPPQTADPEGREGWITFGEPGVPTRPALGPAHMIRPEPGRLVLFPAYMWHGTTPFAGAATRLTMAFDLAAAAPDAERFPP